MGLSKDIENPNQIFEALYTTKINKHTGEEEGTGIGMWLVKSIVKDNDGEVKLLFQKKALEYGYYFLKNTKIKNMYKILFIDEHQDDIDDFFRLCR